MSFPSLCSSGALRAGPEVDGVGAGLGFRIGFEGSELAAPEGLHSIDPVFQGTEWFGPEPIDAEPGVEFGALVVNDFDEAGPSEDAEVAAERGAAERASGGDFTGRELPASQHLNDSKPRRVGEGGESGFQLINQYVNS
jgi:hypothetical protein